MNLADCSDKKRIPIIMTGNDFSTVYAPLLRSGRADMYRWEPDIKLKSIIIQSILDPFVKMNENEFVQFCGIFRRGTISDFTQLKNDLRKRYVWKMIENKTSLNIEVIQKLDCKMSALQRLNFQELCELAEKRIKPII